MTIRELAAGNPMIMDINIDIRENGKLKHIYRFGCGAEYYNSDPDLFKCKQIDDDPEDVKKYVTVDNTEINTHDMESMKDYYTLKLNKIPKKYQPVLDREVSSWNLYKACRGLSIFYDGAKKLWVNVDDGKKELELDKLNIEVHGQENGYQLELEEFLQISGKEPGHGKMSDLDKFNYECEDQIDIFDLVQEVEHGTEMDSGKRETAGCRQIYFSII